MEKVLDKGKSIENLKIHQDVRELTLAITLLAGLSAILIKFVGYFNNNIIDWHEALFTAVYFLIVLVIIEILILFVFILTKGYSIVAPENRERKLQQTSDNLFKSAFLFAIFILTYFILLASYSYTTRTYNIPGVLDTLILFSLALLTYYLIFYLIGIDLKEYFSLNFRRSFKIIKDNFCSIRKLDNISGEISKILVFYGLLTIVVSVVFIAVLMIPFYLLTGSYVLEINQHQGLDTNTLAVTIKDLGTPSNRCFINLYRVNKSDKNLFQDIDNIIINESPENSSEFMSGKKRDGIYYLFIDTTNLEPGYYLIHAEVTMLSPKDFFDFLESKKYDNKLFYLAPSSTGSE